MDDKKAKQLLKEHTEALNILLKKDGLGDIKEEAEQALQSAKEGSKQLKKTLLERFKEFPIVEKVTSLGTAGTVAVSTAAVAQTELAVTYTELVVAQVAEDVWEGVIEPPNFIDSFVDFDSLHTWGQQVIAEKVAEVSELQPTSEPSSESSDPKPQPSASSLDTGDDKPSQKQATESEIESEEKESKVEEKDSSKEVKEDGLQKDKEDKQPQSQEQQTEDKKEFQEKESSSESDTKSGDVKELPIVETPIDLDESIRQVSPTS